MTVSNDPQLTTNSVPDIPEGALGSVSDNHLDFSHTGSLPRFTEAEIHALCCDLDGPISYLVEQRGLSLPSAQYVVAVGSHFGWKRSDALQTVITGWESSFDPVMFFTVGGEGL